MADQTRGSSIEELRRAFRAKEHELAELDLMLTDYYSERSCLIRELRWLQVQLCQVEAAALSDPMPQTERC